MIVTLYFVILPHKRIANYHNNMNLKTYYQEKQNNARHESERIKKKILHISILRVAIFFLGFIALCICYDQGGTIVGGILLCTLIPFLLLVKVHNRLFHQKDWYETRGMG